MSLPRVFNPLVAVLAVLPLLSTPPVPNNQPSDLPKEKSGSSATTISIISEQVPPSEREFTIKALASPRSTFSALGLWSGSRTTESGGMAGPVPIEQERAERQLRNQKAILPRRRWMEPPEQQPTTD